LADRDAVPIGYYPQPLANAICRFRSDDLGKFISAPYRLPSLELLRCVGQTFEPIFKLCIVGGGNQRLEESTRIFPVQPSIQKRSGQR
jgi:hypothetical protein